MTGIQIDSDIYDTYIFSGDTSRITLISKIFTKALLTLKLAWKCLSPGRLVGLSMRTLPIPPCAKYRITFENIPNIHPVPNHAPCIRVLVALRLNSATTSKFYVFSQHKVRDLPKPNFGQWVNWVICSPPVLQCSTGGYTPQFFDLILIMNMIKPQTMVMIYHQSL